MAGYRFSPSALELRLDADVVTFAKAKKGAHFYLDCRLWAFLCPLKERKEA